MTADPTTDPPGLGQPDSSPPPDRPWKPAQAERKERTPDAHDPWVTVLSDGEGGGAGLLARISGEFAQPSLEARYLAETWRERAWHNRAACLISAAVFMLAAPIDALMIGVGPIFYLLLFSRMTVLTAAVVAALLSHSELNRRHLSTGVFIYHLTLVASYLAIVYAATGPVVLHTLSLLTITIIGYVFFVYDFWRMALNAALITGGFLIVAQNRLDWQPVEFASAISLIALTNGLGLQFARFRNRWQRTHYLDIARAHQLNADLAGEIRDRRTAEEAARESAEQLRLISENLPGALFQAMLDPAGRLMVTYLSPRARSLFAVPSGEGSTLSADPEQLFDLIHPDDRALVRDRARVADSVGSDAIEVRALSPGGRWRWVTINAHRRDLGDGTAVWDGVILDATQRKEAQLGLEDRLRFERTLIETMPYPIFYRDAKGHFLGCNSAFAALYQSDAGRVIAGDIEPDLPFQEVPGFFEAEKALLAHGGQRVLEGPVIYPDGGRGEVILTMAAFADASGRPMGTLGVVVDITERKFLERDLRRLATTDSLTGIANRRHFIDTAATAMGRARDAGQPLSLIMLDADHFKLVNDRFGHQVGDRVLIEIADACCENIRGRDLVGRLGGEELALMLVDTAIDGAMTVAERIRRRVAQASIPVGDGTDAVARCTVSIGCAEVLPEDVDIDDTLRRADAALYQAKVGGRDRVIVAQPEAA